MGTLKYISWNVNGLRACMKKGFMDAFNALSADCVCLQETKLQPHQIEMVLPGYHQYWNSAVKKGYSGTALFTKREPLSVTYGLGIEEHDQEGRIITADFGSHYLIVCYTPNSQRGLTRLPYRMTWEDAMADYMTRLSQEKPVILCGDLNVAHENIDLANPASNHKNAGFTDEERGKMNALLDKGFTDSFRFLHPDERVPTRGGATLPNPASGTSDGGSTTSSSPMPSVRPSKAPLSIRRSMAVTTVL